MKYTFISKEQPGLIYGGGTETERTVTFNAHELDVVLEEFEMFLRGCGFHFDGQLVISDTDEEKTCGGNCGSCQCKEVDMDGRC